MLFFIVLCFVTSRAALEIIGILTALLIRPHLDYPYVWVYSPHIWLSIWGVADTGWYLDLARDGYALAPMTSGPTIGQANWAFFPLYPMLCERLARAVGWSNFAMMVTVSNLSFFAALLVAARETRALFGTDAERWIIVLFCVLPGSYVFSSAYAESLFLLLVLACFALLRRRSWLLAGAVAALATLTRNMGVALIFPMLVCGFRAFYPRRHDGAALVGRDISRFGVAVALPVAALAGFCWFLYLRTGDPIAFATIQKSWNRKFQLPFAELIAQLFGSVGFDASQTLNWLAAIACLAALGPLARARQGALLAFGVFAAVFPLFAGSMSYLRFAIVNAPIIMTAAHLCARRPDLAPALVAVAALLNGFMMVCWALAQPISY